MTFMSIISHNAREQFQVDINSIEKNSLIDNIIQEEIEAFITKLKVRLNILSIINLVNDETLNFKDEIRFVLR